ncbi:dihydrodipicolinate synthase family protein [Halarsenatibacter silvermanii]|uniref:4-hydroxy-tetrahydrodipicolinate synthase n=1 Tax=Halarsenatibacter silvermanii TaxID=321763 RepID=A0A1G9U5V1_9FIRM|nr:dihydrodipicolinate synthase family protein [Halarsenatibacter silvermanii]SDM55268.1 4-hydroxy-tetrahydrodipicolinate synthase [Halarsenatibacter silvermanii]
MNNFEGIVPAMITIWDEEEEFDEKRTREHVKWLIEKGVHGLAPCGSTGENISMSMKTQKEVIKTVVDEVDGQIPVYPGTGRYSTKLTIELSKYAESVGADGVMVILPYYMEPYKESVKNHYRILSEQIDIPIMVYNNPWFTGYEFDHFEMQELVNDNIVSAVKAAHGDPNRVFELKNQCGDQLKVLYGHDYAAYEAFCNGADGWLSGLPNVCPGLCVKMYQASVNEKNFDKAKKLATKIRPLVDFLLYEKTKETPPRPHFLEFFKESLRLRGRDVGEPRRPLGHLDPERSKKLKQIIDDLF